MYGGGVSGLFCWAGERFGEHKGLSWKKTKPLSLGSSCGVVGMAVLCACETEGACLV